MPFSKMARYHGMTRIWLLLHVAIMCQRHLNYKNPEKLINKKKKTPKTSILSRTIRFWNDIQRHAHSQKTGKPNNLNVYYLASSACSNTVSETFKLFGFLYM
jgi:hypothetical protein